jgi:hypothetical protein
LLIYLKSLGERNKIQVSQATADLLIAAGKSHWLKPRQGGVTAKGKGVLNTFWLDPTARKRSGTASSDTSSGTDVALLDPALGSSKTAEAIVKQGRLVNWIVKLLMERIKKIVSSTLQTGSLSNNIRPWYEVSHMLLL